MNEEPKSIWKKSWTGPRNLLLAWLGLVIVTMIFFAIITLAAGARITSEELKLWLALLLCATMVFFLVLFIRWLFCWRNFKRFIFGVACLATLIALAYAEEDWRGWHAWNQFKHKWEAKGEKFDWQSAVPPAVPDDQNFAMAPIWIESIKATLGPKNARQWKYPDDGRTNFINRLELNVIRSDDWANEPTNGSWAKGTITDLKPWQAYYRAPAQTNNRNSTIKTNEFPIAPEPQSPAEDVLLALSKYDPAIEELRQASRLPYSRFPADYDSDNPSLILLPHLSLLKGSTRVLQLRAIAELQDGRSEKALDDVKLSLRLADSIRTEPFLISQLVRIAKLQITLQPVYEGLAANQWSEAQLAVLDAELAKLDFLADYKLSTRSEMGFQGRAIDFLIRNRREIFNVIDSYDRNGHPSGPPFIASLIPTGWFYQNELNCARMMVDYDIPLADVNQHTVSPAAVQRADSALWAETRRTTPYNLLEKLMLPALGNAVEHFARAQSSVDLARVAIALERYRLAHGDYPESLDALAPQFIEKVPHDVIGGQPLHYRRNSDGQFVLYSVGWNERDDGGVVVFTKGSTPSVDINQGDWVWRYPQK